MIRKNINIKLPVKRYNQQYKLIKNIEQNKLQKSYAILCNNHQSPNILNIPYFMIVGLHRVLLANLEKSIQKTIPKKFCCIIASNLHAVDRLYFALKLSEYKQVDIYGSTFLTNSDNSQLPESELNNKDLFQNYKFVICFENTFAEEYITEKLPNAFTSPNSIPVYRGASSVGDYFNIKAFIGYESSQSSYHKMIETIIELDQDDKKFQRMLQEPILTEQNRTEQN